LLENWLARSWWFWLLPLLIFWRQILDAVTAPGETLRILRNWAKRTEAISLQYNAVQAIIARPTKERVIGATVRVILDNPHPFPLRIRLEEMVTTFNWFLTSDLSHLKRKDTIGAGARNFAVSLDEASFKSRPNQESFPIRLIWRIRYGRADVRPIEFERTPLNIVGTLTVQQYANGCTRAGGKKKPMATRQFETMRAAWLSRAPTANSKSASPMTKRYARPNRLNGKLSEDTYIRWLRRGDHRPADIPPVHRHVPQQPPIGVAVAVDAGGHRHRAAVEQSVQPHGRLIGTTLSSR
jgi:hypothetical protein